MSPRRVLVCGSNYGTAYIRALRERPHAYTLAGLLARGSPGSRRVAQKHRVPLYTTVSEVPRDVDLACAAMGNAAFDVVLALLGAGMPVLLEHPVWPRDVERAAGEAERHGVSIHINTLFSSLAAPRAFIDACRARQAPPAYLDVLVTDRSLYATVDILRQAFGTIAPLSFARASSHDRFGSLEGTVAGVPAVIRVQRSRLVDGHQLRDGAPQYLVDCRISAWFDQGALTLLSVAGPVLWNASFRRSAPLSSACWLAVHSPRTSHADLLVQQTTANLDAIDALSRQAAGGGCPDVQRLDHLLDVARAWEHIAQQLATPERTG